MKLYIAGPMRGVPEFNFPAFDAARSHLLTEGFEDVVSPADMDRDVGFDPSDLPDDHDWAVVPDSFSLAEAVDRDLQAIRECDAIYLLEGWEHSKGALAEKAVAEWLGLTVMYESEPERTAARHNAGKPELAQLHHFRLETLAAHVSAGRAKYPDIDGVPNWTFGGKPDSEYLDAADRHIGRIVRGEIYDDETGTMHAAAVAWNMLAMITNNYSDVKATSVEVMT